MEYLVVSDSHGRAELLELALERWVPAPDGVLFLGDGLHDLRVLEYQDLGVRCVRGNCDFSATFEGEHVPEYALLEVGAYRIVMMHGHTHGVKGGLQRAIAFAAQMDADVLLYGHTHRQNQEWLDAGTSVGSFELKKPLLLCNPGSLYEGEFGTLCVRNNGVLFGFGRL